MAIYEHLTGFMGQRVVDWEPGTPILDPDGTAYRLMLSWEEADKGAKWTSKLDAFLSDPASQEVTGLVVGPWGEVAVGDDSAGVVRALVEAQDRLPRLRSLFLGDIVCEESEISWIHQTDVLPLLDAFPFLIHFAVRGGTDLAIGELNHDELQSLIIQAGGLPQEVTSDVMAAHLPELRHLELWLGTDEYGGDTRLIDLQPLFSGEQFLNLEYLGLRNSEIADEIAAAITASPLLSRIKVLDLSLGTLTDKGAEALLDCPAVAQLRKLDLHRHYCSESMMERLKRLPLEVDLSDRQDEDEDDGYRYVAVSE